MFVNLLVVVLQHVRLRYQYGIFGSLFDYKSFEMIMFITRKTKIIWVGMFMETRTLSEDVLFNGKRSIILIKTCVVKIKVTKKNSRESPKSFSVSLRDLARVTEKSRMIMVIIQLRRIINAQSGVLQNQYKMKSCFYQISGCKIYQIQTLQFKSFFACTSQIPLFSILMSRFASPSINVCI